MKNQDVLSAIDALFQKSSCILLTAAEGLDGDALGCMYALYEYGSACGKEMTIMNGKKVSETYAFLGKGDLVHTELPNKPYDLIMICDTGDIRLLGKWWSEAPEAIQNLPIVNMDHHYSDYGTIAWVDHTMTSSCDMVLEFIEFSGGVSAVSKGMATDLLAGILYDSGCFRNKCTTSETFEVSRRLLAYGADHEYLVRKMYWSAPAGLAQLCGDCLSQMRFLGNEKKGIFAAVTLDMLEKYKIEPDCIGNVLVNDYVRSVDSEFCCLVKEYSETERHLSFRSKNDAYNMCEVSGLFGGGGHKMASGGKTNLSIEEIYRIVNEWAVGKEG